MPLTVEGLPGSEILDLSDADIDSLVFCGRPITFRIGSADILGEFHRHSDHFVIVLAHIDGGGEGALPLVWKLASAMAMRYSVARIHWNVCAVNCARPNLKLRRVLERKGFQPGTHNGVDVYQFTTLLAPPQPAVSPSPEL